MLLDGWFFTELTYFIKKITFHNQKGVYVHVCVFVKQDGKPMSLEIFWFPISHFINKSNSFSFLWYMVKLKIFPTCLRGKSK